MRPLLATLALLTLAACGNGDPLSVCQKGSTEGSWDCRYRNLSRVDLTDTNLTGANLTRANLTDTNLTRAVADKNTVWPEGFDPEAAGVIFE